MIILYSRISTEIIQKVKSPIVNTQFSWDPLSSDKLSWDKKTTSFPRLPETPQNPASKYREEPTSALYSPSARHLVSEWYQEENLQSTTGERFLVASCTNTSTENNFIETTLRSSTVLQNFTLVLGAPCSTILGS